VITMSTGSGKTPVKDYFISRTFKAFFQCFVSVFLFMADPEVVRLGRVISEAASLHTRRRTEISQGRQPHQCCFTDFLVPHNIPGKYKTSNYLCIHMYPHILYFPSFLLRFLRNNSPGEHTVWIGMFLLKFCLEFGAHPFYLYFDIFDIFYLLGSRLDPSVSSHIILDSNVLCFHEYTLYLICNSLQFASFIMF
jgi:hypothetical protein